MNMMPQPQAMGMAPQMPPTPSPQEIEKAQAILEAVSWEEIEPILRTDERRNYSIDIETDSTVFQDAETEKAQRIEVMGAMTNWLERAIPAIQSNRSLAPLMKELTMFTLGAFKIGRQLEETFEDAFDQIKDMPEQPNPEQQKLEMEAKAKEAEFAGKQKDREADMVFKQQEHGLKQQGMQAELAFKSKELEFKERELAMKAQESEVNRQMTMENAMFDRQSRKEEQYFANEDRQFQRSMAEREFAGKEKERSIKLRDTESRLEMDQNEQMARRAMEADQLKGVDGKTTREAIVDQVESMVQQISEAFGQMSEQQMMIAQALQGISAQQEETNDALTAVVKHMTAPLSVKRDPKTRRAIGVERGENSATDLRQMLESLGKGRSLVRGKDNRVEAFA
jgi:hypothetical protein